jgi:hypothetical protein
MNPKTVEILTKNVPELKELIAFLQSEAQKLDTLAGISAPTPNDIAVEVLARKRAKETIDAMLAPLLGHVDKPTGINPEEFVV